MTADSARPGHLDGTEPHAIRRTEWTNATS